MSTPEYSFIAPLSDVGRYFRLLERNDLWFDYAPPSNSSNRGTTNRRRKYNEKDTRFRVLQHIHAVEASATDGKAYEVLLVLPVDDSGNVIFDNGTIKIDADYLERVRLITDIPEYLANRYPNLRELVDQYTIPDEVAEALKGLKGKSYPDLVAFQEAIAGFLPDEDRERIERSLTDATQTGYLWSVYANKPYITLELSPLTDSAFTIPEDEGRFFRLIERNDLYWDYQYPEREELRGESKIMKGWYEPMSRFQIIRRVKLTPNFPGDSSSYEVLLVLFDLDRYALEDQTDTNPVIVDANYFGRLPWSDVPQEIIDQLRPLEGKYPTLAEFQSRLDTLMDEAEELLVYESLLINNTRSGYLWSIYNNKQFIKSEVPDLKRGDTGLNVVTLQLWLRMLRLPYVSEEDDPYAVYDPGHVTGLLDEQTMLKAHKFQQDYVLETLPPPLEIEANDFVGRDVFYALEELLRDRLPPIPDLVEQMNFPGDYISPELQQQALIEGLTALGFPVEYAAPETTHQAVRLLKAISRRIDRFGNKESKILLNNILSDVLDDTKLNRDLWNNFPTTWGSFYGAPWMGIMYDPLDMRTLADDYIRPDQFNWGIFHLISNLYGWGEKYLRFIEQNRRFDLLAKPIVIKHISSSLGEPIKGRPDFSQIGTRVSLRIPQTFSEARTTPSGEEYETGRFYGEVNYTSAGYDRQLFKAMLTCSYDLDCPIDLLCPDAELLDLPSDENGLVVIGRDDFRRDLFLNTTATVNVPREVVEIVSPENTQMSKKLEEAEKKVTDLKNAFNAKCKVAEELEKPINLLFDPKKNNLIDDTSSIAVQGQPYLIRYLKVEIGQLTYCPNSLFGQCLFAQPLNAKRQEELINELNKFQAFNFAGIKVWVFLLHDIKGKINAHYALYKEIDKLRITLEKSVTARDNIKAQLTSLMESDKKQRRGQIMAALAYVYRNSNSEIMKKYNGECESSFNLSNFFVHSDRKAVVDKRNPDRPDFGIEEWEYPFRPDGVTGDYHFTEGPSRWHQMDVNCNMKAPVRVSVVKNMPMVHFFGVDPLEFGKPPAKWVYAEIGDSNRESPESMLAFLTRYILETIPETPKRSDIKRRSDIEDRIGYLKVNLESYDKKNLTGHQSKVNPDQLKLILDELGRWIKSYEIMQEHQSNDERAQVHKTLLNKMKLELTGNLEKVVKAFIQDNAGLWAQSYATVTADTRPAIFNFFKSFLATKSEANQEWDEQKNNAVKYAKDNEVDDNWAKSINILVKWSKSALGVTLDANATVSEKSDGVNLLFIYQLYQILSDKMFEQEIKRAYDSLKKLPGAIGKADENGNWVKVRYFYKRPESDQPDYVVQVIYIHFYQVLCEPSLRIDDWKNTLIPDPTNKLNTLGMAGKSGITSSTVHVHFEAVWCPYKEYLESQEARPLWRLFIPAFLFPKCSVTERCK